MSRRQGGVTFDTGALIAIERGAPKMARLLSHIAELHLKIAVPAGVLAQVWRGSPRQAKLARLLHSELVEVVSLDETAARAVGVLCDRASTADPIDASVVLCARERGHLRVVTSDPIDLAKLDPGLTLVTI